MHRGLEVVPVAVVERQLDVRVGLLGARVGADEDQLVVVAIRLHLAAVQRVVHQEHGRGTRAAGGAALIVGASPVPTTQLQAWTLRGTCNNTFFIRIMNKSSVITVVQVKLIYAINLNYFNEEKYFLGLFYINSPSTGNENKLTYY